MNARSEEESFICADQRKSAANVVAFVVRRFLSGSGGGGAESGPALDASPVAGLPVSVFGFQEKAGIDGEVQRGLVLEADVNAVALR